MHGTKAQRNAGAKSQPKTGAATSTKKTKQKKAKNKQQEEADAAKQRKIKTRKIQIRGEIAHSQPLSTAQSHAKQLARAQVQLQVKALPTTEKLHTSYASESTQGFSKSPFHYHQVPPQHADMILMGDTKARRHNTEMIKYIDSPLLMVTDPVLRETVRQVENTALKSDKARDERITQHILSTLTGNEKVKAMIKEGASNKTILNAMYNLLPRIMPTRSLRHNVDQLDWLGQIRHRWQNEIEPNGYDVEDSSDADTLPQQRPFTRDEMHRLLQDVEESKYIESDIEENLFAPAVAMGDLKRELQALEIDNQLRFVLKNHQGPGTPPESFDYRTMRRNFKLLLGTQQTEAESGLSDLPEPVDQSLERHKIHDQGHDGTVNELSRSLKNSMLEIRARREKRIGVPYLFGSHAGVMDAQDFLLPATITNAGLGLMPPMFDVLQLPVHYIHDATEANEKIDMYNDAAAPFQSRFDIACAVVLNRVMGPAANDIPVYLTDYIDAEVKLKNHPKYRTAQLAMLKDLKSGSNTAVDSIQALMKEGFHPQDVMKRLVSHLDNIFSDHENKRYVEQAHFNVEGEPTDAANAAITFTGQDLNRLKNYHEFVAQSMKTAKVINETDKFNKSKSTIPIVEVVEPAAGQGGEGGEGGDIISSEFTQTPGLMKTSANKVEFNNYQLQTDADGNFISILHADGDASADSILKRSQLQAQEYGIGNVHRATPTRIDLSNNLGIQLTEPQSSPFGFRPNQKTIYGKQIVSDQTTFEHQVGGLASREVPATRFTTDGTEVSLDPHRAAEYTNNEMIGALDNYHQYVKPRIKRDQILADETSDLFQPGTHGLSELLRFQLKNDPNYHQGFDPDDSQWTGPDEKAIAEHAFPDTTDAAADPDQILAPYKPHVMKRIKAFQKGQEEGFDQLTKEELRAAYRHTRDNNQVSTDDIHSHTDIELALEDYNQNGPINAQPINTIEDVVDASINPHLVIEDRFNKQGTKRALGEILNDPYYRDADVNWSPLNNFQLQYSKFLLKRFEKRTDSRETKFRKFCKDLGLALTDWDSEFNTLIRRVFDGDISDQLTHAARQMTREEQLAALVPVINDWKKVLQHDRSHLLNPTDASDPLERQFRAQSVEKFIKSFRIARAQIRLTDDIYAGAHLDKPGYGVIAAGAVLDEDFAIEEGDKMPLDSFLSKDANGKKISLTNESGEVISTGTIIKPITDVRHGFKSEKSPTEQEQVPNASLTAKLHKNKYTLFDLFEGRIKIASGGGDNAPAITDFDFRAHYMDKVAKDVELFNGRYYTKEEFSTFDDLLKTIPNYEKLSSLAIKLLKAKSQITSNKFINFKRNDTPYQDGDVDPISGKELKIKSLNLEDVDSPLTDDILESIQRHHRLMLNQSDQPQQFNIDINSYINALESTNGDSDAALTAAESKVEIIQNDAVAKQLKRYLQAWRARDIESEAIKTGQGHSMEAAPKATVPGHQGNNNRTQYIKSQLTGLTFGDDDENGGEQQSDQELTPEEANAADDHIHRLYSRHLMGYAALDAHDEFARYDRLIAETGQVPPALKASRKLQTLFREWKASQAIEQLEMKGVFNPGATKLDNDTLPDGEDEDVFSRPDQGLGFQHLHRTPNIQYQKTMDLPVDGDEMDHLRDSLTKNVFDPTNELNLDDRVEWFNEPELLQPFDHKIMTEAIKHWMHADPFLQYMDSLPPGVKEAEVLRSSFSMIPPRLLDTAIKANKLDELAKQGQRRNFLRYNPAFSLKQIKKFRRGLEKYSGIPVYLLDFAEVAFNPHKPFFVNASIEENHLRHMMTEERLRQPARPLIAERPDDSENDTPTLSTPITIGGTPSTRQAAHVQKHYQTLAGTDRIKRIQKFKRDLSIAKRDAMDEISSETELDDEESNIAQDMFRKALDRLLQREATAFLTSDYDMEMLRSTYPDEMARYELKADRRRRLSTPVDGADFTRRQLRDHNGNPYLGTEAPEYQNGFVGVVDTSDEDEMLQLMHKEHQQEDPASRIEMAEQSDMEATLLQNRMRKFTENPHEAAKPFKHTKLPKSIKKALDEKAGDDEGEGAIEGATEGEEGAKSSSESSDELPAAARNPRDEYSTSQPSVSIHSYYSTKHPFAMHDFMTTFMKHLADVEPEEDTLKISKFAKRVADIQAERFRLFDQDFIDDLPLNADPAGLNLVEGEWQLFFDRKSQALPVLGRHRQTLRVMAESYLRHRRLVDSGLAEGEHQPHDFEIGWTFERIYGLDYWDSSDDRAAAMNDYRTFVRANRPKMYYNGEEIGTDDEFLSEVERAESSTMVQKSLPRRAKVGTPVLGDIELPDNTLYQISVAPDGTKGIHQLTPSEAEAEEDELNPTVSSIFTPRSKRGGLVPLTTQLTSEDLKGATAFDPTIADLVEQESHYRRVRVDDNYDLELIGETESDIEKAEREIFNISPQSTVKPSVEQLKRNHTLGHPFWDDAQFFDSELPGREKETVHHLPKRISPDGSLGLAEHFDKLGRTSKVEFLMELLEERENRESLASRREDIVATVFGTQRQLLRRLSDELQLVKRAERTAFKRIYALDPEYARELVSRHLFYATGRRHANDDPSAPGQINWKVELNYIEEIMWSSANRLNARTGGMFPGAPGVSRAHDKTFFTPPPLIAGEFAPMFVDQNMISSGDEYEQARTRLQYHSNADFVACGVTQWKTMGQKKLSMADERHMNDDTKSIFNTRHYIDDGLARDAIMQIQSDFSQYEFTSDAEEVLIEDALAQLSLDAGTNMAFASAIAGHRKRYDARRAKLEAEHPLFYGDLDHSVDWQGGDVYSTDTKPDMLADGSYAGAFTDVRHRLKSLMRSKRELNKNDQPIWHGLYAIDQLNFNEDGTPGQQVADILEGVNALLKRAEKVNPLSSGHVFPAGKDATRGMITPHNSADVDHYHKDTMQHEDAPFDDGSAAIKAGVTKKLEAAVEKTTIAKAKATTDIMGNSIVKSHSKFAKFNTKKAIEDDADLKAAVLAEQAYDRYFGANVLLQANALALRMGDHIDETNKTLISEIGADLLPQSLIDSITLSVLGGKGGFSIVPQTDENIAPFVHSPADIVGSLLSLRPGAAGRNHLHSPTVYNVGRTAKQEQEDLAKVKAGEFTEWTDFETFSTEDDEKPVGFELPYVHFARSIRALHNLTANELLNPINEYDNDIAPGESAAATHPQLTNKKTKISSEPVFDPSAHLKSVLNSKFNIEESAHQKSTYRTNAMVEKYPALRESFQKLQAQIDKDENTEIVVQWAPGGQIQTPKPLAIPDHATLEDVQEVFRHDDSRIQRPLYQQLRKSTRDSIKGSLPRWMVDAKRAPGTLVTKHLNVDGELVTHVTAADPDYAQTIVSSTSVGAASAEGGSSEGGVPNVNAIRPDGIKSSKTKILRQRAITAQEAIALGLDPNAYEGLLTRMQKDFISDRMDEFFASTTWKEDPIFTSHKYIRSLIMFTGLRKLEASPQVGADMLRNMVRGADINDESTLYGDLNVPSFYKYVRTVEKEDKMKRMGVYDKFIASMNIEGITPEELATDKHNPLILDNITNADRIDSPMLGLIRDIVQHAEAYNEVVTGVKMDKKNPTYHPFKSTTKFDKHSRIREEYSDNESDFENVMAVNIDGFGLTTVSDKHNPEFDAMHKAMVSTKKSLSGLSIEEVDQIFKVADTQPPVIRQVLIDLLREYLSAYPQTFSVSPPLHVTDINNTDQNHTGHPLRNLQILSANDTGSFIDQANPRGIFTLEEVDLSLVDMTKRFNMEHGNALPSEDLSLFNKIILDCAREGRVYYPKPKLNEIKIHNDGALPDGTIGFDTEKLAIGRLQQFKPEDLRYSSDTVSVDTFNKIMSLPPQKLQTFMAYQDYISEQARNIAHQGFYKQLNKDIRAVRPVDSLSIADVGEAQHVRKMHTDRSQFDRYTMAPNGYIRMAENRLTDDTAILSVVSRAKYGRTHGNDATVVRDQEYEPETEDPAYNFRVLDPHVKTYGPYTKDIMKDLYRDMISGVPADILTDLDESSGFDLSGNDVLETPAMADRPEDADLGRRFLNMQHWLADPLSPRQLRVMRNLYEERRLEAFWQGTMNPFDSAAVYNNIRMADKMIDADTHLDHDRELARLHREIVVGVVREILDDQNIDMHSLEYDSYNLEPDFLPTYTHYDHVNVFAARRFSPYTTLPLSESNIPPMIGIEQQRNIYNLHLLDPVTFHPRWLARRLNVSYSQCIAILKTYDFRHRLNMHETIAGSEAEYDDVVDGIDDAPLNPDFASADLALPNPPEVQLSQMDEEYLYSRFAPNLIGRVSWTKRREREVERTDPGFRNVLGSQDLFGGDGHAMYVDRLQEKLTQRYMEEEQVLDALEQASFARFGPISYANQNRTELHRPPKMAREIISSSLQPPMRNNWALTTLDERKRSTFGIMIRDRDGYLRHPTYREFRAIRTREKDRRTPFFWRRHHVLGKLPEISSLFIDQVTQIKADFDAKTNLAKDMRSAYDLNFVKQIQYTPIGNEEDVDVKGRASSEDPDAFEKQWGQIRDNYKGIARLDDTTIRARDWLGEYDKAFRDRQYDYGNVTEDEAEIIKDHGKISPTGNDLFTKIPGESKSMPLEVRMARKVHKLLDGSKTTLVESLFSLTELEEMEITLPPPLDLELGDRGMQTDHEEFFITGSVDGDDFTKNLTEWVSGDAKTRKEISSKLIVNQIRKSPWAKIPNKILDTIEPVDTDLDPVDKLKDTVTMKNIMARKAAESGGQYSADMALVDEPSKQSLKDLSLLRKGLKPTAEMFHYQRILARRGIIEDTPYGIAQPTTSEDFEPKPKGSQDDESDDLELNGFGAHVPHLVDLYEAIKHDSKPMKKLRRRALSGLGPNDNSSQPDISEDRIFEAGKGVPDVDISRRLPSTNNAQRKGHVTGFDVLKPNKNDPNYYRQRLEEQMQRARPNDPLYQSSFFQRPDGERPQLLPTDNVKHYLNEQEEELEHLANGPKGDKTPTYIAHLRNVRTPVGKFYLDHNDEVKTMLKDISIDRHTIPMTLTELNHAIKTPTHITRKFSNDRNAATDTSQDELQQTLKQIENDMVRSEESDNKWLAGEGADVGSDHGLPPAELPTSFEGSEWLSGASEEWSKNRPDNEYSYIHHNQKVHGLHMRDESEDQFFDAHHQGRDMYYETYGVPRSRVSSAQDRAIKDIRSQLNDVRANKLHSMADAVREGEKEKYKTLRTALYDPKQQKVASGKVTRVPTVSNLAQNDPALAEYLKNVDLPNLKPQPNPLGKDYNH